MRLNVILLKLNHFNPKTQNPVPTWCVARFLRRDASQSKLRSINWNCCSSEGFTGGFHCEFDPIQQMLSWVNSLQYSLQRWSCAIVVQKKGGGKILLSSWRCWAAFVHVRSVWSSQSACTGENLRCAFECRCSATTAATELAVLSVFTLKA